MDKQYTVIGLGRFGSAVARSLYELGNEVVAVDINEENIQNLDGQISHGLVGDSTHEDILRAAGVREVDAVILAVTDFKTSVMTALICKEIGANTIIAKARDGIHQKALEKIGVDKVIVPERDSAYKLAHNLDFQNSVDLLKLNSNYEIVELIVPEKWVGKTIIQLDVRKKYNITILGINRSQKFIGNPDPSVDLKPGDTILVLGNSEDISKFMK